MMNRESSMTIGELAIRTDVAIDTIRYYERRHLLPKPPRRPSGYRQYPESAITRLQFIRRAKELGFSLKEISELLSLRVDPQTTCVDVRQKAEAKMIEIDDKIRSLRGIRRALKKMASSCTGQGPTSECPILDALEGA